MVVQAAEFVTRTTLFDMTCKYSKPDALIFMA